MILALCAVLAITGFYTDQQLLIIAMDGYGQISQKWEGGLNGYPSTPAPQIYRLNSAAAVGSPLE